MRSLAEFTLSEANVPGMAFFLNILVKFKAVTPFIPIVPSGMGKHIRCAVVCRTSVPRRALMLILSLCALHTSTRSQSFSEFIRQIAAEPDSLERARVIDGYISSH